MKRERIDPPYRVYAVRADGTRAKTPLAVYGLIVELKPGIEIEIDFAPHPNFAGDLTMFAAPTAKMARLQDSGKLDDFTVRFGAANVLHVEVNRRVVEPKPKRPKKAAASRGAAPKHRGGSRREP